MHGRRATVLIVAGRSATLDGQAATLDGQAATIPVVAGRSAMLLTVARKESLVTPLRCTLLLLSLSLTVLTIRRALVETTS